MTNPPLYPGNSLIRVYTFKDADGAIYDPTAITITVTDAEGKVVIVKNITDLTRIDVGVYKFQWNLPTEANMGVWHIIVHATYIVSDLDSTCIFDFSVGMLPLNRKS